MKELLSTMETLPVVAVRRLETVAQALQAALSTPLWLWSPGKDGTTWQRTRTFPGPGDPLPAEGSPLSGPDEHVEARIAQMLAARMPGLTAPATVPVGNDWHVLIVPSAASGGTAALTTMAQIEAPGLLHELAALALDRADHQERVEQLQKEFDVYTAQITDDFEELSFLRNIAQQLESSDLTKDLVEMAQAVLPLLKTSIKAQAVVLMLPDAETAGAVVEGDPQPTAGSNPVVWCGPRHVDEETCRLIVRRFHRSTDTRAAVKNYFDAPRSARELPGVESFILAPISKAGWHLGWLLAVNRAYRRGFEDVHRLAHVAHHEFGTAEAGLVSSAASMLASQGRNFELFREREELLVKVVRALVNAIEAKDPYTCGHSERVALFGRALARERGLTAEDSDRIYLAGLLHDVGKIGVSDRTLHKPGRLTEEEFAEVKTHPDKGWSILNELDQLCYVLPGVVHHHERVDGKGYPDGLAGEDIPLDGRILAVADAYDAMTSDRPYRDGMPADKAFAILNDGAGTQWDPELVDTFRRIRPQILEIQASYERPQQPHRANTGPASE